MEKDQIREIEIHKSELQRAMKDSDFDLHRRRLVLEEEEQRVKTDKERLAFIENRNKKLETTAKEVEDELRSVKKKYDKVHAEYVEIQQQVKILNENLRRESELCLSRDKENLALNNENKTLKEML